MNVDLSQDWKSWDNTAAVTYAFARRNDAGVFAVPIAKRRSVKAREKSPSNGIYLGYEANWWIPQAMLPPGLMPKPKDQILEQDGTTWTALTVDSVANRQRWLIGAVNLVLAANLSDSITIEAPDTSTDTAGVLLRSWKPIYTGLACRVQPQESTIADERAMRGQDVKYFIYLAKQVSIDVRESRILWNGKYLDVLAYRDAERIDELPQIEAHLTP